MIADLPTLRRALQMVQQLQSGRTVPIFEEDQSCFDLLVDLVRQAIDAETESARDKAPAF